MNRLQPSFIGTVHYGSNASMIAAVAKLYLPDGALVADVTYGRGLFWTQMDTSRFTLLDSDKLTCPERPYDFRALPYETGSLDIVVLDPPYLHNPGIGRYNEQYQQNATVAHLSHAGVIQLYQEGMAEARRVLKPAGGQLWVKCKDEVSERQQQYSHIEIFLGASTLGFYGRDLVLLVAKSPLLARRHQVQHHLRKEHSYLWIFTLGRLTPPGLSPQRQRVCAFAPCAQPFTPKRSTGQYCQPTCKKAAKRARNDPLSSPVREGLGGQTVGSGAVEHAAVGGTTAALEMFCATTRRHSTMDIYGGKTHQS